jgi:hypothetical protein
MKNLLIIVAVALLGACQVTNRSQKECCKEAAAMGKECCAEMGDCASACESGKECTDMAQCCKDAKALGKDCAKCAK